MGELVYWKLTFAKRAYNTTFLRTSTINKNISIFIYTLHGFLCPN